MCADSKGNGETSKNLSTADCQAGGEQMKANSC